MTDYYKKYLKYKSKYLYRQQSGGKKTSLNSIIIKLNKKGYTYWLDENGKILTKNTDASKAKKTILKKIKKDNDEYKNKILIEVQYDIIDKDNTSLRDGIIGPVEVVVSVNTVKIRKDGISIQGIKNNDLLRFYYFEKDLAKFKLNDMKKIATEMVNTKKNVDPLKYYSYRDIHKMFLKN
jgi:hypothetical protein